MNSRQCFALIRHGDYYQQTQTPSAHQPYGLTPKGRQQACQAAETIKHLAADMGLTVNPQIHSSTLLRAWETAELIAADLQPCTTEATPEIVSTDALCERSVGALANLTAEQITAIINADPRYAAPPADWKSNSHYCLPVPGAESLLQAGERIAAYLRDLCQQSARTHQLTLVIGHGASIRHGAFHLGILPFEHIAQLSMHHADPVIIEHTGGHWRHIAGHWKVRANNSQYTD